MSIIGILVAGILGAVGGASARALLHNRQLNTAVAAGIGSLAFIAISVLRELLGLPYIGFAVLDILVTFVGSFGTVLIVGALRPKTTTRGALGKPKEHGIERSAALALVGCMLLLSAAFLLAVLPSYDVDSFEFWAFASMGVVAAGAQVVFLVNIAKDWESMSPPERGKLTVKGVFLPPLIAMLSFVAIGLVLAALVMWLFAASAGSSGSSGVGGGSSREVKDRYGNRLGSLNTGSGEVKDRYGNRTGWINPRTGRLRTPTAIGSDGLSS